MTVPSEPQGDARSESSATSLTLLERAKGQDK
jgi:hypothetical protein